MSNANAPFGLKPINLDGTTWSGQGRLVYIPSSQGAIYIGDPLIPLGSTDAYGVPAVGIASDGATDRIAGSFLGQCNGPARGANSASTLLQSATLYHPASTAGYALMCDDPSVVYEIQEDSDGGAIAITTGGYANGNLVTGSGGSTATGLSSWMLDSSSVATGNATYQVKVIGLVRGPDNAIGNYARWVVQLNLSALAQNTAGF